MSQLSSQCAKKARGWHLGLLMIMLMLALPGYSHASWSLSTRVMTTGGAMQVRSGSLQTSANGTVYKTYTTSQTVPVALLPNVGYQVSGVSVNGTALASPYPDTVAMGLPSYPTKTSQTLSVSFAKKLIPVTGAVETPGGGVSPSGTYSLMYTSNTSFTFTPDPGYRVYKILGLPSGATLTDASTGAAVTTFPYAGAVRASFAVPGTPVKVSGAFVPLLVNAGTPKTILSGGSATLRGSAKAYDGSYATDLSFAWTFLSNPGDGTISNANASVATFTATTPGTYKLQLQVTDSMNASSTSTTYVIVTDSFPASERFQCQDCHDSAGFTRLTFNAWSSSKHNVGGVVCAYCHVGSDVGSHPTLHGNTVDKSTFLFNQNITPPAGTGNFCLNGTCHSRGVTHKTDGMACGTCHTGGTHNVDGAFAPSQSCSTSSCHNTGSQCYQKDPAGCASCHTSAHGPNLLHHFAFANITTQQACTPFSVTITAQDAFNNTVTAFTGKTALTVSPAASVTVPDGSTLSPKSSEPFGGGVWSGQVKVSGAGPGRTLTARRIGGTEYGTSNPFTVTPSTTGYIFTWDPPVELPGKPDPQVNKKGEAPPAFEQGTIPLKFKLRDCTGAVVTTIGASLVVTGPTESTGGDGNDLDGKDDDDYRFRITGEDYHYNLSTKDRAPGTYSLTAVLDNGASDTVYVTVK
jgi:hypothetical protein